MNIGFDVATLSVVALACVTLTYLFCKNKVEETDGKLAMLASASTGLVMLVSYIIMAHVLDSLIGIYW